MEDWCRVTCKFLWGKVDHGMKEIQTFLHGKLLEYRGMMMKGLDFIFVWIIHEIQMFGFLQRCPNSSKKAYNLLQIISKDEKSRMFYKARETERRDQISWMKSAKDEGEAKGKAVMAQDSICQYLEARLGVKSQVLQDSVQRSLI